MRLAVGGALVPGDRDGSGGAGFFLVTLRSGLMLALGARAAQRLLAKTCFQFSFPWSDSMIWTLFLLPGHRRYFATIR